MRIVALEQWLKFMMMTKMEIFRFRKRQVIQSLNNEEQLQVFQFNHLDSIWQWQVKMVVFW